MEVADAAQGVFERGDDGRFTGEVTSTNIVAASGKLPETDATAGFASVYRLT